MILTESSKIRNRTSGRGHYPSDTPTSMKLSKFERKEAERSGFTVEELREFFAITPCACGKCKGWQVWWKFGAQRRREG